jgi:CBS domain-containing protein
MMKFKVPGNDAAVIELNKNRQKEISMFEAKTVMKTDVFTVKRQTPIYEAIELLVENHITGLPVVNDDMTLAGIVTEKDVLKLLSNLDVLMVVPDLKDSVAAVEDFMTKDVVSFDQNDDLFDICECLIDNSFRRVPVTSGGKVVGIISRRDVVGFILKMRDKDKSEDAHRCGVSR